MDKIVLGLGPSQQRVVQAVHLYRAGFPAVHYSTACAAGICYRDFLPLSLLKYYLKLPLEQPAAL